MADSATTRPSLLIRIRDARDGSAWTQFEELYAPLIRGFCRKHGLQDADAEDLTQDVLRVVADTVKEFNYDPASGSFRGWLFTVVRNQLRKFQGRKRPCEQGSGRTSLHDLLEEQPAPSDVGAASWNADYQRRIFAYAAAQVRGDFKETTWQAFWQTAVDGNNAREVAKGLGMTVAAVYLAKSRVMARLKEQVRQFQGDRERAGQETIPCPP